VPEAERDSGDVAVLHLEALSSLALAAVGHEALSLFGYLAHRRSDV
jgi:hypothetical protein